MVEVRCVLFELFHVGEQGSLEFWLDLYEVVLDLTGKGKQLLPGVAECVHSLRFLSSHTDLEFGKQGVRFLVRG